MPSVSKTQQRLMGQALAYKRGEIKAKDLNPQYSDEIKKLAKSMTEKQLKHFASTKHKNLPEKVKESNVMTFDSFNEAHKEMNHKDQKLSKDMKKQSHVSSKKPSNKKISSEDSLAEKPKKGQYREPSNKKLSSEEFLAKDQKLTHVKEFKRFINESSNEQEEVLKWWNSLDITLQIHLANEYSANFDIIETIPYDEILNIYKNEMSLTESVNESQSNLTDDEKEWLEAMIGYADDRIGFESDDIEMKDSIFSKLGIGTKNNNDFSSRIWGAGSGY